MKNSNFQKLADIIVFSMLGTIMFISKILMEAFPNIHFIGMLTMVYTVVYRKKALIPIYVYVFINGLYAGFSPWWVPYLYVWTVLWAVTMLLPKNMSKKTAVPVFAIVCALHGLCFGALYAPVQAIMFHLDFKSTLTWIAAGLPFDAVHALGNLASGLLIIPLSEALKKIHSQRIMK